MTKTAAAAPKGPLHDEIEFLKGEVAGLTARLEKVRDERDEAQRVAKERRERIAVLENANNGLLDTLNGMTIEKARLEGYIDRAREVEAPPAPTVLVPMPTEEVLRKADPRGGYMRQLAEYGSATSGPTPWYRREI